MSTISLRLPDSLHKAVRELADREGISINMFITLATAEKLSALQAESYIQERAKRADKSEFEAVLAKIPKLPLEDNED
jgi:hypothetical protein